MSRILSRRRHPVGGDYLRLIRKLPLRPIRSRADYNAAAEMLDLLIGRTDLSPGETDYLEGLTRFVEDYDQSHPIFADESNDALSRLKSLMEISGTTALQLGQILKSRSAASMVLRGTRELSKTHIRKLAAHFKLNPGYFF